MIFPITYLEGEKLMVHLFFSLKNAESRELIIYCTEETDDLDASHCSSYFLSLYREYFWTEINMPNL